MSEFLPVRKMLALGLVVGVGATACGGKKTVTETMRVTPQPPATWVRPPSIKERPIMTLDECYTDWWNDVDGQRQPLLGDTPPEVRVDGRCNRPLNDNRVGIYDQPEQIGKAAIVAHNGDEFYFDCYTRGQSIQDERGPSSASNVWIGVTMDEGKTHKYLPETNAGYIDEKALGIGECK